MRSFYHGLISFANASTFLLPQDYRSSLNFVYYVYSSNWSNRVSIHCKAICLNIFFYLHDLTVFNYCSCKQKTKANIYDLTKGLIHPVETGNTVVCG